jgi:outer membrane protein assembly factor BamA
VDWWNPFSWFGAHKYDGDELDLARVQMREMYTQKGYLDAQVGQAALTKDEKGNLVVTFGIVEGPCYSFGRIAIEGNTLFPDSEDIRNLVKPLKTGEKASSTLIEGCRQAIRD